MVIYVDSNKRCHPVNDGTMTAVETDFFKGKCDAYIEGYCLDLGNENMAIYPWKPYAELDAVQREYEQELLADMERAWAILLGGDEA